MLRCLFPDMASAFLAVDPNTPENGCMQVLRGSHKLGRVEHGKFGDQTGADPERVEHAKKIMDLVYVELAPGDVLKEVIADQIALVDCMLKQQYFWLAHSQPEPKAAAG